MRKKLFLGALLGTAIFAFAAKDPVIMKINGKDIKLSEFEYLYKKNNMQQVEQESLEQYLERFIVYKLKVEDALNERLDTAQAYIKEFNGYKRDLCKPYLEDSLTNAKLIEEAYDRMQSNVEVYNIYIAPGVSDNEKAQKKHKADSLYQCLQRGDDFKKLAELYSEERGAQVSQGYMGFLKFGQTPYEFENKIYSTEIGKFSEPFQTKYGWHLVKVVDKRQDPGKVLCEHILKLYPRGVTATQKKEIFAKVYDIYNRVKSGENFEEVAKVESEDPGSAKKGGMLPFFGTGEMVKEFEKVAFELQDGEISEPFETSYGVHIIKKLQTKGIGTIEDNKSAIQTAFSRDERATMAKNVKLANIKSMFKFKENKDLSIYLKEVIVQSSLNDSVFISKLKESDEIAFSIEGNSYYLRDVVKDVKPKKNPSQKGQLMAIENAIDIAIESELTNRYIEYLQDTNISFKNLLNEYNDGMLLFEVSNKKVWNAASVDTEGLENFYIDNKNKYLWSKPKFKGLVLLAENDSILDEAKKFFHEQKENANCTIEFKKKFRNKASIDKVLCEEDENPVVDYLAFKSNSKPLVRKFASFSILEGKIISQPENVSDVKVQVVTDYQAYLEDKWVKELKEKYPVKINKKVLKKIKE